MGIQKFLYGIGFAFLATIMPVSLPAQAETLSPNSIEITREDSNLDGQQNESKNRDSGDDHNHDQGIEDQDRDSHDYNRNHDGQPSHHNDRYRHSKNTQHDD